MKKLLVLTFYCFVSISANAFQSITETATKVGINNTSPDAQLHIGSGTGSNEIRIDGNQAKLRLLSHSTSQSAWIQWGAGWTSGSTSDLHFSGIFGLPYIMTIKANGNIGVGTNNPEYKFQVQGSSSGSQILAEFNKMGTGAQNPAIQLASNNTTGLKIGHENHFQSVYLDNSYSNADKISFKLKASTKMVIFDNGNVGIGTADPGAFKLAVNGTIRAKEVKVETGWSDFVFEDDYYLPSLEEVERFIRDNKHLPEIPSAKEVEENGVNLGEMDSKLLQKIEELTLYMIDLKKEVKQLKKENERLSREIEKE